MIGIEEYAFELGRNVRTVEDIAGTCTEEVVTNMRKIGLDRVPTDNERILWDMIKCAVGKITHKPDCILIAHSLPFIIQDNGADSIDGIPTYFISGLPCAIIHKTVQIACEHIYAGKYQKVLVIGADKAYSDQERIFFGTIMGDGVVALLLSEKATGNYIVSSQISTTIYAPDGENSNPDDIAEFRSRNVFMMREAINTCMNKAGIDKVNYFVTHTSNRGFWDGLSQACRLPRDMFLDGNIRNTGHMNSHDSFYHFFYWLHTGQLKKGDLVMLINPGFGGTQGCTLIEV